MLTLLRGISSGRSLDSPSSYYYSGSDAAERAREDSDIGSIMTDCMIIFKKH